jgi:hypothetical protein
MSFELQCTKGLNEMLWLCRFGDLNKAGRTVRGRLEQSATMHCALEVDIGVTLIAFAQLD